MIKFHSEKQEEMLKEVREFSKETLKYLFFTRQEITFVQDTLRTFKKHCSDFSKKLEILRLNISSKLEESILNKESKLQHEKKSVYNSILTYTFRNFQKQFEDHQNTFDEQFLFPISETENKLNLFLSNEFSELSNENAKLTNEITLLEKEKLNFRSKKEEYFDCFNQFNISDLVKLNNQKKVSHKGRFKRFRTIKKTGRKIFQEIFPTESKLCLFKQYSQIHFFDL